MIKHILKILWKERKQNAIVIIELFIIATVLWYVADMFYCRGRLYTSPKGYDIENTFNASILELMPQEKGFDPEIDEAAKKEALLEIEEQIRRFDGVEEVCYSLGARPGFRGVYQMGIHARNWDPQKSCNIKVVQPSFFDVYKYEPIKETREELKKILSNGQYVMTQDMESQGLIVGDTLFNDNELTSMDEIIGAAVAPVRGSKFRTSKPSMIQRLDANTPLWVYGLEIGIRVNPSSREKFAEHFKEEMAPVFSRANLKFNTIEYNPDAEQVEWEQARLEAFSELFVLLFLLANILLGVAGVFWYRTVKRRSQIGLRISYGSTPSGAQRLFMLEATMMMVIGVILAAIVMWLLYHYEIPSVELIPLDLKRYIGGFVITILTMLSAVLLAVWMPTRKTKRIPPAVALREE